MAYMGQGPQGTGGVQVTTYGPGAPLPPAIAQQVQFANHMVQLASQFAAMAPTIPPQPYGFPAKGLANHGFQAVSPRAKLVCQPGQSSTTWI